MSGRAGGEARPAAGGVRLVGYDRLRGLAVCSMLIDHLAAVLGGLDVLRWSLGRPAMPIFALVVGALATRPLSRRRLLQWLGVALAVYPLYALLGLPGWEMVVLLLVGRLIAQGGPLYGGVVVVVALAQAANGVGWDGHYAPGAVAGLCVMGRVWRLELAALGARLPGWLAGIGRRPLTWYVGHLAALAWVGMVAGV